LSDFHVTSRIILGNKEENRDEEQLENLEERQQKNNDDIVKISDEAKDQMKFKVSFPVTHSDLCTLHFFKHGDMIIIAYA